MTAPDSDFLEIFKDEANERLDRIVDALLALERGEAASEAVDELLRETHTIKGAAGMLALDQVRDVAHAMEDLLASAREAGDFPASLTEPLLQAADSLRRLIGGDGGEVGAVVDKLAVSRRDLESEPEKPTERAAPTRTDGERRSIRVPAEKIDALLDLVGETVLHRRRLEHSLEEHRVVTDDDVADELIQGDRLVGELKDAAIGMRTLPLASITGGFPRAVRDLASSAGKEVELFMTGADTELDRAILEGLAEPLVHLLRNSIAHGIEPPEERARAGKPRTGRLELRAEQRGGLVEIVVADDGRGVSAEIQAEARKVGSLADVLTSTGFSTARQVDDLSGRGVGLDAVKAHVESFGGSLDVRSEPGRGTDVVLLVPLALALVEVLLVERGPNVYGIPLGNVEEAIAVTETLSLGGRAALELRGHSIPLVDLAQLLGSEAPPLRDGAPAIVVSAASRRMAAACDRLLGEEEVVVKSLGGLLAGQNVYLGAAILGDSRIALLLDPAELVRAVDRRRPAPLETRNGSDSTTPKVLVVEDSFTVRELQRSILEAAGYSVDTAHNGREALERLTGDETIELVLTDVEMPEMDGIALTESIRALPERSELPVVIVTTRSEDEDRRRGVEAGADAYMAKRSFDQQTLLETVERLIGR